MGYKKNLLYWNASPQKVRKPTDNIKKGYYKKHTLERIGRLGRLGSYQLGINVWGEAFQCINERQKQRISRECCRPYALFQRLVIALYYNIKSKKQTLESYSPHPPIADCSILLKIAGLRDAG
ncbi:MAG: hypothetical protein F6J93_13030 [Oscillatoria sp. SIO1A7]|nr:hypothetical protein [Oscillatoria sp. SIO1A7]